MTLEAIRNRRSVREYLDTPIPDEDINEIIKAAQYAPTGHGNGSVEFIVIKKQETKDKIFEITGAREEQDFMKYSPVILILVTDTEKATLSIQDLSVASENVFLEATSRELGTVWKNISPEEVPEMRKLLDLPENFVLINIIPIGYPKTAPEPKNESDFNPAKIHFEKW